MLRTATLVSCISTLLLVLPSAHGHGVLNWPPSRVVLQNHHNDAHAGLKHGGRCLNHTCAWWGGMGSLTTNQTIPDEYRTVTSADPLAPGMIYIHPAGPWMSPGTASSKIAGMGDAICGISDSRMLDMPVSAHPVVWKRGAAVEVAFGITANHGGGYRYSLCPLDSPTVDTKCFESHPLQFVGPVSWLQYGDAMMDSGSNHTSRTEIRADRLTQGTTPRGSEWTKMPVPACTLATADSPFWPANWSLWSDIISTTLNAGCTGEGFNGTEFPEPAPGVSGGAGGWRGVITQKDLATTSKVVNGFDFSIVDKVHVPTDLKPGSYLLQWRWDCEGSAEIFEQCADVLVE